MFSRLVVCTALIASCAVAFQGSGSFSISVSPNFQSVWQGGSANYLVTVTGSGGFSDVVTLAATGLPAGVSATMSPASITGSGTSTMTINASAGASVGGSSATLTGNSSSSGSQSTAFSINVVTPPPVQYSYDALGRLISVTDQTGASAVYNYDAVGNVTSIVRQNVNQVNVAAFSPNHGLPGSTVTVLGSGFNTGSAQNVVTINGLAATVGSASANQLTFTVPSGASTGAISVVNSNGSATSASAFTVDGTAGAPSITSFTPSAVPGGGTFTITGTNLAPNPVVMLGATQASVYSASPSQVTVVVPSQSGSGRLSLQTPNGQATSGDFFYVPGLITPASVVLQQRITSSPVSATFTAGNQAALAVFDATAGQHLALSLQMSGDGQVVSVLNPDGSVLVGPTQIDQTAGFLDLPSIPQTGTYEIAVTDDADYLGSITIGVSNVPTGDFSLSVTPQYYGSTPQTNVFNVFVGADQNDCTTLSVSGLPAGVTAQFGATSTCSVTLTSITFTASSSAVAGSYPITITGNDGTHTHSATITFVVSPLPSGWLNTDIDSQNGSTQFSNGTFTLECPMGDGYDDLRLTYQKLSGDGVIIARVTSNTGFSTDGVAAVSVGGVSIRSSLTDTAHLVTLRLNSALGVELVSRSSGTILNFSTALANIAAPYWLKLVRQGNTISTFVAADGQTWTQVGTSLSISFGSTAYIGLTSSGESAEAQTTFDNVSVSTGSDFSVGETPTSQVIAPANSTTYSVSVSALAGFAGSVSLSTGALPSGVTASISPATITNSGSATLTLSASATTTPAVYPITISASSGSTTHVTSVSLNVGSPDFSLAVDNPGQSSDVANYVTYNVSMTALNGLQTPVALSVTGLPNGATASFSPTSISSSTSSALTVTLGANTPARTYNLSIIGTAGSVTHILPVTLMVIQPDFSIAFTPTILTFPPSGGSSSTTVALTPTDGFSKTVSLNIATPTNGITASLGSTSITTTNTTTLSMTVPPGLTAGTYNLNVTGTESSPGTGPLSHTDAFPLLVYTSGALPSGWSSADLGTVAVSGQSGYTSPVFTAQGSGTGVIGTSDAAQFASTPFLGNGTIIARLTGSQNGTYPNVGIMVRESMAASARSFFIGLTDPTGVSLVYRQATGSSSFQTAPVTISSPIWFKIVRSTNQFTGYTSTDGSTWTKLGSSVSVTMATNVYAGLVVSSASDGNVNTSTFDNVSVSSSSPQFSLSASPTSLSLTAGASATSTVSATFASGFTSSVAFGLQGLPTGLSGVFSPTSLSATGTSTLTLTATTSVAPGTYSVNVTGTSGSLVQTVPLTVTVGSGFALASSGVTTITAGSSGTNTVTETASSGFSDTVTLAVSGLPSGVSAGFSPTSLTSSGTSTLTLTVSSTTAGGTYPITVTGTGTSSGLTRTTTFNLVVKNFSLASSPSTLTVSRGGSAATSTITLTMAGGFNSSVSLSVVSKPSGVTVSFSPTSRSSTGTSTMTVSAASGATTGTSSLTVKGTNGSLSQTTTVTLTVN